MRNFSKSAIVVFMMLVIGPDCGSAQQEFDQFISRFPRTSLPFKFGQDSSLIQQRTQGVKLSDDDMSRFIAKKDSPAGIQMYRFYYFACPIWNDSVIGVIYKKVGGSGGIELIFEMALFETRTRNLVDRMKLFEISGGGGRKWWYEGEISKEMIVSQKFLAYELVNDGEQKLISTRKNRLRVTKKGFEILEGKKETPTRW